MTDWIQCFAAVFALILSGYAIRGERRLQRQITEIEMNRDKERQIEKKKALLVANYIGTENKLLIKNEGQSTAKSVNILIEGNPLKDRVCIPDDEEIITTIGAGQIIPYALFVNAEDLGPWSLSITWDDAAGGDSWEGQISI